MAPPCRLDPESLAMRLGTHQKGGADSDDWFRRRDADGCGRDDCGPEEIANDSVSISIVFDCSFLTWRIGEISIINLRTRIACGFNAGAQISVSAKDSLFLGFCGGIWMHPPWEA
jgi:hypothetical protein